jgi:hypothetical protein
MYNQDYWIQRYTAAYKEEFGEDLSPAEALSQLTRLTNFLRAIQEPNEEMPEDELDEKKSSSVQLPLF